MFGILARSLHTATRMTPPSLTERPRREPRTWNAPRHWLRASTRTAKETRRS